MPPITKILAHLLLISLVSVSGNPTAAMRMTLPVANTTHSSCQYSLAAASINISCTWNSPGSHHNFCRYRITKCDQRDYWLVSAILFYSTLHHYRINTTLCNYRILVDLPLYATMYTAPMTSLFYSIKRKKMTSLWYSIKKMKMTCLCYSIERIKMTSL